MILNKRTTCLLLLLATLSLAVADVINVIIDPSKPTDLQVWQYSSFSDLMSDARIFEYANINIQIPADTRVLMNTNCTFSPGKISAVSLQGSDRKSSIIEFSSDSQMNSTQIDFTITNLTILNVDRVINAAFFKTLKGTLTLSNSDVNLTISQDKRTNNLAPAVLHSNFTAVIDNVNATITGPYVFFFSDSAGSNLTVKSSTFDISQGIYGDFLSMSSSKSVDYYKQTAILEDVSFSISDTTWYGHMSQCYLCFLHTALLSIKGMSLTLGKNTELNAFVKLTESANSSMSDITVNVSSPNVTMISLFRITRYDTMSSMGPFAFENFSIVGPGQKLYKELTSVMSVIEVMDHIPSPGMVKNLTARDMVFDRLVFLKLSTFPQFVIDTVRIRNSVIHSTVVDISTKSKILGSDFFEENTTVTSVSGLEISDSQIVVGRMTDSIIHFFDFVPSTAVYLKPFMDTLVLDGLKLTNNQVLKQDIDIFNTNMEFISTVGWNFFVVNSEISGNKFYRSTVFKLQDAQPNIRFSNVRISNSSFEDSVLVKKALDPKSTLLHLVCNRSVCKNEMVPNYRYMALENSTFDSLTLQDSALFQGNIMNFIGRNNYFNRFSLNRSTIFEFKYMLSNEPPVPFDDITNSTLEPTEYPTVNKPLSSGRPTILLTENTFSNSSLNKSLVASVSNFDIYLRFEYFYSQVYVNGNNFSNFTDISQAPNNLLNFWHSGNIKVSKNRFQYIYTTGDIFCVKYNDAELQENGMTNSYGSFLFVSNDFRGGSNLGNISGLNLSQTGILNIEMTRVREFRFEWNSIDSCTTINRGLINIKLTVAPGASNVISFTNNHFMGNQLVAGNDLKGNFITFECNPMYPKLLGPRPSILFQHNLLANNIIDGGLLLTGSLLSVMPTFLQIRSPEYALKVQAINIMGSNFRAYGYLFTAIALSVDIQDTEIRGCKFREEERLIYIESTTTGMQGIFFFSSPMITISNIYLESNSIQKGSYFFLDNYWIHDNSMSIQNRTQSIYFSVDNSQFTRNDVEKGAIIMYSGGFFGVVINLKSVFVETGTALMDYFLKVSDPSSFKLKVSNSTFKIDGIRQSDRSSNLFYLNNFDPGNSSEGGVYPVMIDNCTFYTVYYNTSLAPPEIFIMNGYKPNITWSAIFSKTQFLPAKDSKVPHDGIGGLKFRVIGSSIAFEKSLFKSLETRISPIFDVSESSSLRFLNSSFMSNHIGFGFPFMQLTGSNLVFQSASVLENIIDTTFIDLVTKELGNSFMIINSEFTGNILSNGSAFIQNTNITSYGVGALRLQDTYFQNNTLREQSNCIRSRGMLRITNSYFIDNIGNTSVGTAVVCRGNRETYCVIDNTKFENNVARVGGAINVADSASISDCVFSKNSAIEGAGAVFVSLKVSPLNNSNLNKIVTQNTFINNIAPVGQDYLSYPDHLKYKFASFESKGMRLFAKPEAGDVPLMANFTPGTTIDFGLNVTVYDAFDSPIPNSAINFEGSNGLLELHRIQDGVPSNETKGVLFDSSNANWNNKSLLIQGSNISLATTFNSYVTMTLSTEIQRIPLGFRFAAKADNYCPRGYIYDETLMKCQPCGSGWYSRGFNQTKCITCPQYASCYIGLDVVNTTVGYWANMSEEYVKPIKCSNNPRACLGGPNSECLEGHYGPACDDCDYLGVVNTIRYVKAGFSRCNKCASLVESILYATLVGLLTLLGEGIFVAVNIISNDRYVTGLGSGVQKNPTGAYFRLLATYLQILYIIRTFNIEIPPFLSWILNVGNPTQAFFQSSQCLIVEYWLANKQDSVSLPFFSSLVTFGFLFIKYIMYLLLWVVLKIIKGGRVKLRHLTVAFISLFYLEQPSFVNSIFAIVSCKVIGDKQYLTQYPSFACSTEEYEFYRLYVGYPLMAVVVLVFPGIILFSLYRKRGELKSKKVLFSLGTLVSDYKSKYFYWAFVLMVLKLSLIFFANVFPNSREFDLKIKALGLILVFTLYLFIILRVKPYSQTRVYNMDRYLTYLNISTIFFTYLSLGSDFEKIAEPVYWICFLTVVITNVLFIVYVIKLVYQANAAKAQIVARQITGYFYRKKGKRLLNESESVIDSIDFDDEDETSGPTSKLNVTDSGASIFNSFSEGQEGGSYVATVYMNHHEKPL